METRLVAEFQIGNKPRLLEAEDLPVKFGLFHRDSPLRRLLTDPQNSRKNLIISDSFTFSQTLVFAMQTRTLLLAPLAFFCFPLVATAQESTREDFLAYAQTQVGRYIGEVTWIADWPGLGKKGDTVTAYWEGKMTEDGNAVLGRFYGGAGSGTSLIFFDAATKQVVETVVTSGGTQWRSVITREDDSRFVARNTGSTPDGKTLKGTYVLTVNDDGTFVWTGSGTIGGEETEKQHDVWRRVNDK